MKFTRRNILLTFSALAATPTGHAFFPELDSSTKEEQRKEKARALVRSVNQQFNRYKSELFDPSHLGIVLFCRDTQEGKRTLQVIQKDERFEIPIYVYATSDLKDNYRSILRGHTRALALMDHDAAATFNDNGPYYDGLRRSLWTWANAINSQPRHLIINYQALLEI